MAANLKARDTGNCFLSAYGREKAEAKLLDATAEIAQDLAARRRALAAGMHPDLLLIPEAEAKLARYTKARRWLRLRLQAEALAAASGPDLEANPALAATLDRLAELEA